MNELYVSGHNFQEISTQVGVSVGYVSSVKEKYEEKLGKGELEAVHEFTKIVRKLGMSPQQALIGARTFSLLEENKLKSEELELFLKKVSKIMQEKDFELSTIIDAYEKVLILQSRSKVSLEHLPAEYESLSNRAIKLQKEISELVSTKKIAEDELNDTIKNCKVVKDDLGQFQAIKNRLEKHDIDFKNLPKIENIFSRAADTGFDFDRIKKHLEKEEKYETQKALLEDKIRELLAKQENLEAKNAEISEKISSKNELLKQIQHLDDLKISASELDSFLKKIVELSKERDISNKQAFSKFLSDLTKYDKLLGFEKELERVNGEFKTQSNNLEKVILKKQNFEIKYKDNLSTIHVLKKLKQKGIDSFLIFTWNKIFETSNLNPTAFEEKLQKLVKLNKVIITEQYDLAQLTKEKKKLESTIDFLKSNREKLESTIKYGNELIKKSLTDNIQQTINQINKTTTMGNNSIKNMQDGAISSIDKISQETFDQMKENVNKTQSLVNMVMESSEKIGQLEFFIPLYKLANGSFVVSELYPTIIALLDKFSLEAQRRGTSSSWMISRIRGLREEMIKELSKTG